eukprot:320997_1
MIKYCQLFCISVIYYANSFEENKYKKLKFIEFKTTNLNNSKISPLLKACVKKYQLKSLNIKILYMFKYESNHIIHFTINTINEISTPTKQLFEFEAVEYKQQEEKFEEEEMSYITTFVDVMDTEYKFGEISQVTEKSDNETKIQSIYNENKNNKDNRNKDEDKHLLFETIPIKKHTNTKKTTANIKNTYAQIHDSDSNSEQYENENDDNGRTSFFGK